ncbi:MAG: hypothetical protein WCA07_12060, partial [Gloeobacterales cyanobacterium]
MTINNRFISLSNSQKYFQEIRFRLNAYFRHTTRNPEWTLMNIISRSAILRDILRHFRGKPQFNSYDLNKSLFNEIDVDFVVDSLKRDGYFTGIKLPKCIFREIMDFALSTYCFGNLNARYGFLYSQKKLAEEKSNTTFSTATYYNLDLLSPAIRELANDPILMMIAGKYFRGQPVYTDSRLWWTFATDETNYDVVKTSSFFHYDIDDYSCLRFFFYLTDVGLENGP